MTDLEKTIRSWIYLTTSEIIEEGKTSARLARLHTLEDVLMAIEEGASDA